jgi:predicted ATPase
VPRTRLFEAVARLVERVIRRAPVLLLIDDAHEADTATLALLAYLCRRLGGRELLTILTYRSDDRSRRHLRDLHTHLRRDGVLEEVTVSPMDRAVLGDLAAAHLGGPVSEVLLDAIEERSGRIPLFAVTLLTALRESGNLTEVGGRWSLSSGTELGLPPVIRDVVLAPLEGLADPERTVVDVLAVAGETVEHGRLEDLTGLRDDELVTVTASLRAAGMIDEVATTGRVSYRLHHPLIAEVAYEAIGEIPRRRIHQRFVTALEDDEGVDLQRLARHYRGAGSEADAGRALEVLTAAGLASRGIDYLNYPRPRTFTLGMRVAF